MKKTIVLIPTLIPALLSALMFGFTANAGESSLAPKDALASFNAALAAGDKAGALELLAPDVTIYESGYVERSRDEYASHHLAEDIQFAKAAKRNVLRGGERVAGNMAVVWQETETTGTWQGKALHLFGTETAMLEKRGNGWVIVHVHWSSRKAK